MSYVGPVVHAALLLTLAGSMTDAEAQPSAKLPPNSGRLELEAIGEQQILLESGRHGLTYFPDEGISVIHKQPLAFLMVAGTETWLMQGPSWAAAKPVQKVLVPSADGPDNSYAGIGAVHIDVENNKVYAFYHAEDQKGYQKLDNGVPNFMASICLSEGAIDGRNFEKRGPVLTTFHEKNPSAKQPQGVADVTVSPSADGRYLYAWYTDQSRDGNRGVQICMARSPIADHGKPGSWRKWRDGEFSESGLGGRETPVVSLREAGADAWAPNVVYVPECRRYVMVLNATVYADFEPGSKPAGGIRLAHSADGIHWSQLATLVTAFGIPMPGKECAIHPTFIVVRATDEAVDGTLLYGYSPKWGHTAHEPPHHLASRTVRLKVVAE